MPKKYFWIKLKDSFFNQLAIKKLRKLAGGDTFTIIYLKMMLLAMNDSGKISYECEADEFMENLALDIDEEEGNVALTLAFLKSNKLLEHVSESEVFLPEVPGCTGGESDSAERVRKHRQQHKPLQCNTNVTDEKRLSNKNVTLDIDIDIDKDKDKDKEVVVVAGPPPLKQADADEIILFWNKNIHPITQFEAEAVIDLAKDVGRDVVLQAMEQACSNNVRKWSYVRATAVSIANGDGFQQKKKQEDKGDYWDFMTKGLRDGDNEG